MTLKDRAISNPPLSPPSLAGPINIRMHDPHVSGEGIISGESLLVGAQMTSCFRLACVVNCVFVTGEVIWTGEDGVARFAR